MLFVQKIVFYLISVFLYSLVLSNEIFYMQGCGYDLSLYIKGLIIRLNKYLIVEFLLLFFSILINFNIVVLLIIYFVSVLYNLIYIAIEYKVDKLKWTQRVLRIFCTGIILLIGVSLILLIFNSKINLFFPMCMLVIVPLFLIFSIVCLSPIEFIIGRKFIRQARSKLSSNSKLIKIGITGSYGKTSVKEILNSILSTKYFTLSTPKSFNTPFGITKTINSELTNLHEVFICEMGAKKKGEIAELCNLVNVDFGIITSVGCQHTNTFGNIETIYSTKKELADYLNGKTCIFNLLNRYVYTMFNNYVGDKIGVFVCKIRKKIIYAICLKRKIFLRKAMFDKFRIKRLLILFEFVRKNIVYAKRLMLSYEGIDCDIYYNNKFILRAESKLIGFHNVINILLAVAMAIRLNVDSKKIAYGIKQLTKISARFEKNINSNGAIIINNGYNSNLDSAKSSFSNLSLFNNKKKVVVTPGLIDCVDSYKYNYEFGKLLSNHCDEVIIVKHVNRLAITDGLIDSGFDRSCISYFNNFDEVRDFLNSVKSDTVVLIENDLPDNFK